MNQKLTFGQGLNADALSSELGEGVVSDCSGVRFVSGFAELVGGESDTGVSFTGTGGGQLSQLYTSTNTYIVNSTGTAVGVYTVSGSTTPATITRKTEGKVVSSATAAGTTVTVNTSTNHGLSTGDVISAWGFTPSTYNAESVAITKLTNASFSYVVASAPAVSPATAMGMYSVDATTSHVSLSGGGEFNGVLILNSTTDGCYYWGGNTSIPFRKVVGSYTARVSVPFGNYIVQLAPTISGTEYPFRICWSNAAEPGTVPNNGFTSSTTNQAGDVDKPEIGELVGGAKLGDDFIIYGTNGRIAMRYIGGNEVFSFTRLPGDEGLYASNAIAVTPIGHVFVDRARHVRVHSGGLTKDISAGRVQSLLGVDSFTTSQAVSVSWVVNHRRRNEVWIGYLIPASSPVGFASEYALIWNWEEDTWGRARVRNKRSVISVRADSSANMKLYACGGSTSSALVIVDDNESAISQTAYIVRAGIDAGDIDTIKNLQRSRWNIDNISSYTPTFTIEHGSSMYADTSPTYATGVTYVPGTNDYANARATGGRFMAVKLSVTTAAASAPSPYYNIRVRSADIDFTTAGKR